MLQSPKNALDSGCSGVFTNADGTDACARSDAMVVPEGRKTQVLESGAGSTSAI